MEPSDKDVPWDNEHDPSAGEISSSGVPSNPLIPLGYLSAFAPLQSIMPVKKAEAHSLSIAQNFAVYLCHQ